MDFPPADGPPHMHLEHRHRFGIRLVARHIRESPGCDRGRCASAGDIRGRSAPARQAPCAHQEGSGFGNEPVMTCASCRVPASLAWTKPLAPSPMWQLAHATRACGPACQAVNCGVIGDVTDLPAERRRLHPVQAPVAAEQQDDDVHGRERRDGERPPAYARLAEVEDRPPRGRFRMPPQLSLLQPHAGGDQREADQRRRPGWRRTRPGPRTDSAAAPRGPR